MSIKRKLLAILGTFCAIILLMTGITYFRGSSMLHTLLNEAGTEVAVSSAQTLERQFDKLLVVTKLTAAYLENRLSQPGTTRETMEDEVVRMQQTTASDGVMQILLGFQDDGEVRTSTRWKPDAGYDVRTRPWYKMIDAAPKGQLIITDPYLDLESNVPVISMGVGIYDAKGTRIGGLCIDMKLDPISDFVVSRRIFKQGSGVLVSPSGLFAAHRDKDLMLKGNILGSELGTSVQAMGRRMVAQETGFIDYDFQGETRKAFFAPVGHGFSLAIYFPVAVIDAMVYGLTLVLLVVAMIAILASAFLVGLIVRSISRAIRGMTSVTDVLSEGDLTARFEASGRDELARIAGLLNSMLDSISGALSKVRGEAEESSKQASTLAALSQETLASMEEVSASVAQVNGLMEAASASTEATGVSVSEIAASAQSSAQASTDGAQQATQVAEAARDAAAEVSKVLKSMASVGDAARQSLQGIRELGQSVDSISGFVATITSIADQTNLLALNAAIEAARAGEAGRGFAVVAEEVRKLAEESGRAAQEVSKLIANLQRESESSTAMTESAGPLLQKAMEDAESAQKRLSAAQDAIESLNQGIQSIAAAAEKQAASSEEIAEAMKNLSDSNAKIMDSTAAIRDSSHETTTAAESIATAAQSMAETSERLNGLVDAFVLDGEKEHPAFLKG